MIFANKFFLFKNNIYIHTIRKFVYNFKLYTKLNAYNFDTCKPCSRCRTNDLQLFLFCTSSSTGKIDYWGYIDNNDGYIILYINKCQMNILK